MLVTVFIVGCQLSVNSFDAGIQKLNEVNAKYDVDLKKMPADISEAVMLRIDLKKLKEQNSQAPESFQLALDFEIKSLEATIVNLKAWEPGEKASTRKGFGCKSLPIVVNSTILRNKSAQLGFEAVELMQEFVDKYPEEGEKINVTQRDVVFTNFFYSEVEREAQRDRRIIEHFCIKDE